MNENNNGMSPERFTAERNRANGQNDTAPQNQSQKPRFKIKDGNIIRINPDGTTTSRPLTDDERRRLEEARMNAARRQNNTVNTVNTANTVNAANAVVDEAARRRADQKYLARSQAEAAEQLGVTERGIAERRRRSDNIRRENQNRSQRKRKITVNPGAIVFALLMVVVVAVSAKQIKINEENKESAERTDLVYDETQYSETDAGDEEYIIENVPSSETQTVLYETEQTANTEIHNGKLILVNYEYEYVAPDSIELTNAYESRTGNTEIGRLKVSETTTSLESEAFAALERLVVDMKTATGTSDLMIVSGYRTYQDQVDIYDSYVSSYGEEYAKSYVADPGHSEHQTGLACDLKFYTSDGYAVSMADYEYGPWVGENCMYEGFIRRYPEDKVDITKISYEAWHFRYVGIPHAYAITTLGCCLEEYIDYLKDYTTDTKILHINDDMTLEEVEASSVAENDLEGGWLTYYVPMSDGDSTDIPVLQGDAYGEYEISGNNIDGFIVTVELN